tara:strand:- start:481 stop:783 length:303 start_codon:yes stop_codon:yes gene_type:complete
MPNSKYKTQWDGYDPNKDLSTKPPPTKEAKKEREKNRTKSPHLTKQQRKKSIAIKRGINAKTEVLSRNKRLPQDISKLISSYAAKVGKNTKKRIYKKQNK